MQLPAPQISQPDPVAPEAASNTSGTGGRPGEYFHQPPSRRASGGGSIPAPEPRVRASTSTRPRGSMRQSSSQRIFSTEWVQDKVKAITASLAMWAPCRMHSMIAGPAASGRHMAAAAPPVPPEQQGGEQQAGLVGQRQRQDKQQASTERGEAFPPGNRCQE